MQSAHGFEERGAAAIERGQFTQPESVHVDRFL